MKFLFALTYIIGCVIALFIICEFYVWVRKCLNRPKIGGECLPFMLKKNDYVSINGKVLEFSHFTKANETIDSLAPPLNGNLTWRKGDLAFRRSYGLGYVLYDILALRNCDFIYGKYGLKWARSKEHAINAKEEIQNYFYD